MITLKQYTNEQNQILPLIQGFWKVHSNYAQSEAEAQEELFILPEYQGKGFGSKAIRQLEEIVKKYSVSLYIEAAARNEAAIRLYRKLGYNCLNTITLRRDFPGYEYDVVRNEKIYDMSFEIRKDKDF